MTCDICNGWGCLVCMGGGMTPAKGNAVPPKVGELHAGRCKRCRGEALRIVRVGLDKLTLFCKLCGTEQEVSRG